MVGAITLTKTLPSFEAQDLQHSDQREDEAIANLPRIARFWLTEDVVFIISPEERFAFLHLRTNEERDQFIEQFWNRRAADPKSLENSFKQEHYRRIVFANERFGREIPGWKTDRGRVYVTFGPPDSIESHRAGEKTGRLPEEGVEIYEYSWEKWHYKYVEDVGENVDLEFVDPDGSRNYRLAISPEERDKLLLVPHYKPGGVSRGGVGSAPSQSIVLYVGPAPTPLSQFKDLEAVVVSRIIRDQVYFSHRIEFAKVTYATTLAKISMYIPKQQPISTDSKGNLSAEFEIFGRISKQSGRVVETFERSVSLSEQRDPGRPDLNCQVDVALEPAPYRLAIAVKNVGSHEVGVLHITMDVPADDKFGIAR